MQGRTVSQGCVVEQLYHQENWGSVLWEPIVEPCRVFLRMLLQMVKIRGTYQIVPVAHQLWVTVGGVKKPPLCPTSSVRLCLSHQSSCLIGESLRVVTGCLEMACWGLQTVVHLRCAEIRWAKECCETHCLLSTAFSSSCSTVHYSFFFLFLPEHKDMVLVP